MATRRKLVVTKEEIDRFYEAGDLRALQQLNETYAKRANERLSALEKADMGNTAAANIAKKWLSTESDFSSGDRFSRSKKMTLEDLKDQLTAETDFLRSQTSSVAGEKKRRENIFKGMVESDVLDIKINEIEDPEAYKNAKESFMKFLDEDVFSDLIKKFGATDIINLGAEAIMNSKDPGDLQDAFDAFLAGELDDDVDELSLFEGWAGVSLNENDTGTNNRWRKK